jgi:WD40 repeat protein
VNGFTDTPNGKLAFLEYQVPGEGPVVQIWDLPAGQLVRSFVGPEAWKFPRAITADGRHAVSDHPGAREDEDQHLVLWQIPTGEEVRAFETRPGEDNVRMMSHNGRRDAAFTSDGKYLITVDQDASVRRWDVATGKLLWRSPTYSLWYFLSPDGRRVLAPIPPETSSSCSDLRLRVWDCITGSVVSELTTASKR